ncbi:MobA/MobL family protein [Devosia sp. XGJD_8]|uniref:MobA/MobL family protein n=1 Tax=Devosia sp. XGJD_8 TaxID=3391187 RepID=UPI0039853C3C
MPIGFARCVFIQRSKGHSALGAAAYIGRQRLSAPYPNFDYSDRKDLLFPMRTIVPEDTPDRHQDAFALWQDVELASKRKDSSLGLHLMLALPAPAEMPAALCLPLLEEFIGALILPHGLATSFAIHDPHKKVEDGAMLWLERPDQRPSAPGGPALSARNRHAHLLISPRRVGPQGIEARRYTALDPAQGSVNSQIRGIAHNGVDWPELWRRHQNEFFARYGLDLRVRPWAAYTGYHRGKAGAAADRKNRLDKDEAGPMVGDPRVERANRATVADPAKLLALVGRRPFVAQDLRVLVERYAGLGHPYDETAADAALALPEIVRLGDQHSKIGSPWLATHTLARAEQRCIVLAAALMDQPETLSTGFNGAAKQMRSARIGKLTVTEAESGQGQLSLVTPHAAISASMLACVAHGWGGLEGVKNSISPYRLKDRLRPSTILFLDHADAIAADELAMALMATLETEGAHLILTRRPHGPLNPRNPLLDIIAEVIGLEAASPKPVEDTVQAMFSAGAYGQAVEALSAAGKVIFVRRDNLLAAAAERIEQGRQAGKSCSIVCGDHELAALMRMNKLPANRGKLQETETVIVVHSHPSFDRLTNLPLLAKLRDPIILADNDYCPDLITLAAQTTMAMGAPCATVLPAAQKIDNQAHVQRQPQARRLPVRWAVNLSGEVGSTREHIATSLRDTLDSLNEDKGAAQTIAIGPKLAVLLDFEDAEGSNAAALWEVMPQDQPAEALEYDLAEPEGDPDANYQQHDQPDAAENAEPDEVDPGEVRDQGMSWT